MSIDPHAGTAINAAVCIAHPREVRSTMRQTAKILRKQAGRRRRSPITCQIHYGHDRALEALDVCYTDPTPVTSPNWTSSTPSSTATPSCSARWSSPPATSPMPDGLSSPPPVEHAKTAADAIAALDQLDPAQLAQCPEDVYALLEHLSMLVSPLWRISAELGRLLDDWADQRGLPRPSGEPVCALHIAAYRLQAEAAPHAMQVYGALDAAQHVLDPATYRSHYGLDVGR